MGSLGLILYLLLLCAVGFLFISVMDLFLRALCIKIKNLGLDDEYKKNETDDDSH